MATPQASSRLELLQARFQQKQLQEKEQKLLQLYDQQQQRAYQVVQRGSAGSNGSNHGSTISHHSVTKTTTTSHTTSTSQGGKVRQMFDERRQTTVKGIDRSYPLEPLENKPRKQTNGNVAQKNGNLTVNRQSVTVKRVARADVNSNLNGGKPIVSYHEEITRESYGPDGRQQPDDDEFGNENHVTQYANGNQTHIEEVLDEDTIERNRMMAKLHLMEYDETLKYRVKNDLESEQFPEDFMVEVPDKLPKRSVTKKLSQAEARLERFKNANAKRSNSIAKNPSTVLKKRSDPIIPAKSTSSEDEGKTRIRVILDRGSRDGSPRRIKSNVIKNMEDVSLSSDSEKNLRRKNENFQYSCEETEKLMGLKVDEELEERTRRSVSPKYFYNESEKLATTYAIDSKTREKLSPELSRNVQRRSESPEFLDLKTKRKSSDQLSKDKMRRSESPKFYCKETEKSATTYAINSKTREKLSPDFSKNIQRRSESPEFLDLKTKRKSSDQLSKDKMRRSESPKFYCKESEKSATTYAIDSKTREKSSPEFSSNVQRRSESPKFDSKSGKRLSNQLSKDRIKRSESPKFFCKESEKSATTYAIDSKTREKLSPDFSKNVQTKRESPEFIDLKISRKSSDQLSKNRIKRSESPKFFCKETEKSATTYAIDSKTREKLSPDFSKNVQTKRESPEFIDLKISRKSSDQLSKNRIKRSESPKFFCKESEKSATTYAIDSKTREKLSPDFSKNVQTKRESPEFIDLKISRKSSDQLSKNRIKRSESPKFFCKETEKSATTYAIDSKTKEKLSPEFSKNVQRRSESPEFLDLKTKRESSDQLSKDEITRSESPKFFCKESEKSATTYAIDSKTMKKLSPEFSREIKKRSDSPKYFCKESEKSATTYEINSRSRSTSPDFLKIEPRHVESMPVNSNFDTKKKSVDIDIVDRKIIPHKPEKMIKTSPRNYHKTETEMDSKSTRNKMPDVFERLTRERSSSPKLSQTTTSSTKDLKFISKSPDITHNHLQKRNKDSEIIRVVKSKSPNLTKKLGRSSTSPQFFISDSERSATIMLVTPETILKKKPESPKSKREKENSNSIVGEPRRIMSEEIVDASAKHSIRSSESRFFSDQCEKASRNLQDNVQSARTDKNLRWSRDSSPLSLRDMRTSPRSPQTEKSVSTTAIDGSRDWSLESRRNSGSVSPKSPKSKSTESGKRSGSRDAREIAERSKSKSPDFKVSSLRSTRLIRDAIKRENDKNSGRCDPRGSSGNSRVSSDAGGTHEASDEEVDELPASGSNSKSCTSVEVDAEIQEITMPDQYIEHRPLQGDKTRGESSTERLFTYSVREAGSKRGSLFELSKEDRGKTDRREASGRKERAGRNAKSNPSPTNSLDSRGSKLRMRENRKGTEGLREKRILNEYENLKSPKRRISRSPLPANNLIICELKREELNRKTGIEALGSRENGILDKYDNLKNLKESISRSSSPANNLTICDLKRQREEDRKIEIEALRSKEKRILNEHVQEKYDNFKQTKRNKSNSPSPTNNLICHGSKHVTKEDNKRRTTILNKSNKEGSSKCIRNTSNDSSIPNSKWRTTKSTNRRNEIRIPREKTPSPVQTKQKKESSRSPEVLRSMKLVQRAIKGKSFEGEEKSREIIGERKTFQTEVNKSDSVETRKSNSTIVYIKNEPSSRKNYERTDSVKSALERFDSIGTESVQSATEKNRILEKSETISLKALGRIDADLPSTSVIPSKMNKNESKTQGIRCQGRFARARNSIEIARFAIGSKSPVCKRKLFRDADSGDETETGSSKSRYSLNSGTIGGKALKKSDSKRSEDDEVDETSTNTSLSVSVKQLRSIEDIRKSIDTGSDTKGTSTKSAIANDTLKRSNETQLRPNPDDRAGGRKEMSGNLAAKKHALGDAERSSIKCAMRFFRVTKSPSPDSTKTTEPGNRARRNVLSSPSKSPDTVARRPSTEMKAQEAKTSKRPTLVKGTEPIGNRKTMTATSTRKSTDVVDGAILENGVHLRDQTVETKYDNDPVAAKKSDAFVIEFDEQPPKENDAPIPRKSLLRKQSIDRQTPSVQSGRPSSSISSTSSGSSMQAQVSGSKTRMASKAKTLNCGSAQKVPSNSKTGGNVIVPDNVLIPCKMCGRRFAQDRVALHEQICTKTAQKKRKQFDTTLYRIKGTDLEQFVKKGVNRKQPEKSKKSEPKSNWRRKHEEFINAIRSAKQVQAHLAAGGKLSDLPPPPPCDTSDYIQCPHCGRKFNQPAAERHIPKCETMLHNKPIHSRAPKPKR